MPDVGDAAARESPGWRRTRLADFIDRNKEPILAEWVTFAESSGPAARMMDLDALRDHALQMLEEIAEDLRTPQSDAEQARKSLGKAAPSERDADTAAEVHGSGRAESGFTVGEMVSEYRALRASVIRLWTEANGTLTGDDLVDLMRFNEAIDQSLAESVSRYTQNVDQSREIFIAILGHDLRSPLGAVLMGAQFMLDTGELVEPHRSLTERIARSARRMNQMVGDLLDFTRGRLGSGIAITREDVDLQIVLNHAVEEVTSAHPEATFQVTCSGDLRGRWDAARISQVIANLLGNAIQHGASNSLITVTAQGEGDEVVMRVHNHGPPIPKAALSGIFSPFRRIGEDQQASTRSGGLGLGLYIVERVVTAHGGRIDVRSSAEAGTLFSVRLPR